MAAILLAATVPRVVLAVTDQGVLWPDEIYQSLEQAHRVVFGYGFIPWEFQEGARSWLFPGTFVLLWKVAAAVGVRSAIALVVTAKLFMVGLAIVGVYASMRIAERLGGAAAGFLAGCLAASFPGSLIFGHRCLAEMASGPVLAVAVWFWLDGTRRRMFLSGLLAAGAIFLRYQNGLFAVGLFVALLLSNRRRNALVFAAGGMAGLFAGEMLDWITWGEPFHSLHVYIRYNLIEGKSAAYGVSSAWHYFEVAWSSTGITLLVIAVGVIFAWTRARALVVVAIAFLAVHCLVPHKEYRFLMPAVPLLLALAGTGLATLVERTGIRTQSDRQAGSSSIDQSSRRLVPAAVAGIVMSALMAYSTAGATLASIGQWADQPEGDKSVWHHSEGANVALAEAGKQPDACGVLLAGLGAVWSGGFTYLHRDVPFLTLENASSAGALLPLANYVILAPEMEAPPGYEVVQEHRGWSLRRRDGGCVPPPVELTRLFDDRPRP